MHLQLELWVNFNQIPSLIAVGIHLLDSFKTNTIYLYKIKQLKLKISLIKNELGSCIKYIKIIILWV